MSLATPGTLNRGTVLGKGTTATLITSALTLILVIACQVHSPRADLADCREAALRYSSKYTNWDKQIHFNRTTGRCYLSMENTEAGWDDQGRRLYSEFQQVVDIDENRPVIRCSSTRERGTEMSWTCVGPSGEFISRENYLTLQQRYLER